MPEEHRGGRLKPRKGETMAGKKPQRKKSRGPKTSHTKTRSLANKTARKKKTLAKSKSRRRVQRGRASDVELVGYGKRGLGADSGGQSGDTQGLPASSRVDSESIEELLEEGQSFEAEVLNGVEHAPDPDESEVHTREVSEEDVPEEYREKD